MIPASLSRALDEGGLIPRDDEPAAVWIAPRFVTRSSATAGVFVRKVVIDMPGGCPAVGAPPMGRTGERGGDNPPPGKFRSRPYCAKRRQVELSGWTRPAGSAT